MTLSEKIKQIREQKKMTQKEVASLMGISQQAYYQYESGTREPKKETISRIADALGVPVWELSENEIIQANKTSPIDMSEIARHIANIYEYDVKENEKLELLKGAFYKLNPDGQEKALERVRELAEIPRYQNPDREKEYVKVWCGPTLPNGLMQYTQLHGELSKDMKAFLKEHPHADCLLVPLKEENAVRVMLEHEYVDGEIRPEEKNQYDILKSELYPAGQEKTTEPLQAPASAAENPTEAPQDHTVKRDTPSHD